MTCLVEQRRRAEHAEAVLQGRPQVRDVAKVGPGEDPTDRFVLDVVLSDACAGVPPQVSRDAACLELAVRHVAPQGCHWHVLFVLA